jgi:hypothetical protein
MRMTKSSTGNTNEVVDVIDGIRQKRLGGGDIIVSEVGLGTQRWVSDLPISNPLAPFSHPLLPSQVGQRRPQRARRG